MDVGATRGARHRRAAPSGGRRQRTAHRRGDRAGDLAGRRRDRDRRARADAGRRDPAGAGGGGGRAARPPRRVRGRAPRPVPRPRSRHARVQPRAGRRPRGRSRHHARARHRTRARGLDRRRDRVRDPGRPLGDAGDDGGHDPARALGARRSRVARLADAPGLRAGRVADLRAPGRPVPRVLEPDRRLSRRRGRGARSAHGQGFGRGGERPARAARGTGARAAGRPRVRVGRRAARGRDRAAPRRARAHDRVRRVAHGRRPRRADHRGAGRLVLLPGFGRHVLARGQAVDPRGLGGHARGAGAGEPRVRGRDGLGGAPGVRRRPRGGAHGCGRPRASRRRRTRAGLGRARRRGDRAPARLPLAVRPRARPALLRDGGARPRPAAPARPPAPWKD